MTTIDSTTMPETTPPPPSPGRVLRRTRTGRVGAGVSSGLGRYFGVDPVLFRVLFATSAFFGGAGIIAYLLAWAAIPDEGTERAPIDGWIAGMRRHRVPFWTVAIVAGILLWAVAFSWWAPGPFIPVIAVVILLIVVFNRRDLQGSRADADHSPVSLTKESAPPAADQPSWVGDMRSWVDESRAAGRDRRRRAMPVRLSILGTFLATIATLAAIDAITGIPLVSYFWATLAIVVVGLGTGMVLRRTPWSVSPLLPLSVIGVLAFAGSHSSLSDGLGQHEWRPTAAPSSEYRLAFGQGILDLRTLDPQTQPRTIHVTMGAGQVKVLAPRSLNLSVQANIHIGELDVDGRSGHDRDNYNGIGISRTVDPPAGATGVPIVVDVHLADGNVTIDRH